jgi:hypothetical protein
MADLQNRLYSSEGIWVGIPLSCSKAGCGWESDSIRVSPRRWTRGRALPDPGGAMKKDLAVAALARCLLPEGDWTVLVWAGAAERVDS